MASPRAVASGIAAVAAAAVAVGAVGCGSSNEISPEQVASIKTQALRELKAEQRERAANEKLRKLERDLRRLKKERKTEKRAAPQTSGGGTPPSGGGSGASCGGGISVNSVTTCPFAANVAAAFYENGPGTVYATSPVTGQTYAMSCSAGVPAVCTGGNGAAVYIR